MRLNKLLSPGKIGTLELKNRFVVPPMGTNFATYEVFSDNAARAMNLPCGVTAPSKSRSLRLRFIEHPIVFSFGIRYNKGREFVSKQVL